MSNVSELKSVPTVAAAVKAIESGRFHGDPARFDKQLFALRNLADFALVARNAATSTVMAIQSAVNALEQDGVPTFTGSAVTSALYRAQEANLHAQVTLDFARLQVRKQFVALGLPVPPHYHENECACEICRPIPEIEDPTEHG